MKKMWKYLLFLPLLAFMVACDDDDTMTPEPEAPTLSAALAATADLSTLRTAVTAVDGLVADLEGRNAITVFAPNNAAFTTLLDGRSLEELVEDLGGAGELARVLQYHVVASTAFAADLTDGQTLTSLEGAQLTVNISGGTVTVSDISDNTWTVQTADVEIANGVVHIINGVLLPDLATPQAPLLSEAIAATPTLSVLGQAVGAVPGLLGTLEGLAAVTIFAPENDAFTAALAAFEVNDLAGLVEAIGGVENLELVLGFHVVPATAFAGDLAEGANIFPTVAGQEITVTKTGAAVTVTDANGIIRNVVAADVAIRNGVVHIIDGVLLPEFPLPTLVEAATEAGLTTLLEAVGAVDGLGATLLGSDAITVFAPTNEAFGAAREAYGVDNLDDLVTELGGVDKLNEVLGFHVVASTNFSTNLEDGQVIPTLNGQDLIVSITSTGVFINGAQVTIPDVAIANGVVHVIDAVLLPELEYPTVVEAANIAGLTTLIDAVTAAELGATLLSAEEITVFAPTNDAFAKLLAEYGAADLDALIAKLGVPTITSVLKFHVVPSRVFSHDLTDGATVTTLAGEDLTINIVGEAVTVTDLDGSVYNVTATDVVIENGVVHVIDGVLLPLDRLNLVETATTAGLTTLLAAIEAVDGLGQTLLDADAITVFAPTNDAFADALVAFNAADLNELVAAIGGVDNLSTVLGFHVVPAVAYAGDLAEGDQPLTTLAGQDLIVNRTGATVTVKDNAGNTYTVTTADVTIENGVVHVIDGVLLPALD